MAQRGSRAPVQPPALRVGGVAVVARPDARAVEARRSDGVVWRRHWLEGGRLVIEFVDLAAVEVDETTGLVTFDRILPAEMEQHLLFDHVLPLVLARGGALVLHGAVISRTGKGAVLVGPSGAGKSTITAFAWRRGWTVGGDDGAVVFPSDPPGVEPTYTTLRLTPATVELLGFENGATSPVVGKRRIAGEDAKALSPERVELRLVAIIEPVPSAREALFEPLSPAEAHARLFGSTFHADLSAGPRLAAALEGLASIVEGSTVGQLTVPRGLDGLDAAERILRSVLDIEADDRDLDPVRVDIDGI